MVFFTCNACGESLKKVQVEKHVSWCRGCQVLSCIDCGKDFWGDDYKTHIKCISEDQKYGGKGFEAKANKGDMKQQQWIQRVHEALNKPGISSKLKNVLEQISTYDNVPRKKAKFQNWIRNSVKITNTSLQEEVWEIIAVSDNAVDTAQETKTSAEKTSDVKPDTNGNTEQNSQPNVEEKKKLNKRERKELRKQKNKKAAKGADEAVEPEPNEAEAGKKKKERKRKHRGDEEAEAEELSIPGADKETDSKKMKLDKAVEAVDDVISEEKEAQSASTGKFNWKGNIKAILRESPDQELPVKKLRKKVLAAFYSFTADRNFKTEQDVLAIFSKKINSNPKFRVLKERVRLIK